MAENTEAGTDIGDPLTASDDDDTVLTYSIVGWKDGSLSILTRSRAS